MFNVGNMGHGNTKTTNNVFGTVTAIRGVAERSRYLAIFLNMGPKEVAACSNERFAAAQDLAHFQTPAAEAGHSDSENNISDDESEGSND